MVFGRPKPTATTFAKTASTPEMAIDKHAAAHTFCPTTESRDALSSNVPV
jgi:hypothetical protein